MTALNDQSASFTAQDFKWMRLAFEQAEQAALQQEVPVGAVIVSENQVIGLGSNAPISRCDPTAHAEIVAIRHACLAINNYRLPEDATLYVTLEPCTMCVGALIHARIHKVIFATPENKSGSLVSARRLLEDGYYNHRFEVDSGCMADECATQLSQFFKQRRLAKKALK
ncbi:tRNA adenosine(34) deaminase TadA [Acinetobacter rathckeae]|uniref:tRNA adenosine(34) deaminase TadA n=1 Tax=Acinetobacter rathckeae TaxID=2605272 RepID=UPI0018A27738|nr:tRNA adenosine(34) deaminase TadA [Acinetobacter rathckeae]MBF7687659.1 tRNA adenosine(34) deaminase TadA [Acinetobacter rathckeae]MBF7695061.1 tRNA adenosine(34) deaminase TadA [Acinetobacter rathckeae]